MRKILLSTVAAISGMLIAASAYAQTTSNNYVQVGGSPRITEIHVGTACVSFQVDKLPGVSFAVPTAPITTTDGALWIYNNLTTMANNVVDHAVANKPFASFAYDPTVQLACLSSPGYPAYRFQYLPPNP